MLTFFLLSSLLQTCSLAWCFAEVYLNKRINISLTELCCNNLQIFFYCANHKQATQPQRFTEQQRIAGWKCLALLEVFPLKVLTLCCSLWEWQRLITFLHLSAGEIIWDLLGNCVFRKQEVVLAESSVDFVYLAH